MEVGGSDVGQRGRSGFQSVSALPIEYGAFEISGEESCATPIVEGPRVLGHQVGDAGVGVDGFNEAPLSQVKRSKFVESLPIPRLTRYGLVESLFCTIGFVGRGQYVAESDIRVGKFGIQQ